MRQVEIRSVFEGLREEFSKKADWKKLHDLLYVELEKVNCLDFNYPEHIKGHYKDAISGIDKLNFQDCCAWLTFVLRWDRQSWGAFENCLKDGSLLALLKRACELLEA